MKKKLQKNGSGTGNKPVFLFLDVSKHVSLSVVKRRVYDKHKETASLQSINPLVRPENPKARMQSLV